MEFLSPDFFSALLAIVVIDLVLAGDNAIVIALAARKLPPQLQIRAVVWGTAGAIAVRVVMTLIVVWLLRIPALMGMGGLLLVWIAYKLLAAEPGDHHNAVGKAQITGFWAALRTIIYADAIMGLDNVLGVAGAAKGDFLLVVLGLLISIPIMVWGSTMILKLVDRYPVIVYLGAGVLAWTAAQMLVNEPLLKNRLADPAWLQWAISIAVVAGVLLVGWLINRKHARRRVVLPAGRLQQRAGEPDSEDRGQKTEDRLHRTHDARREKQTG